MALKTLSSTGISNNNPILPGQVTQSVNAFTGVEGYAITVSGSFTFTGATTGSGFFSNAVNATTALNASKLNPELNASANQNYNVLFASTSSADYENIYKEDGTIMIYNPSTNLLTVTSSFATTASFAVDYTNPTLIEGTSYPSGSVQVPNSPLKFIAGASKTDGSSLSVVNISETSGRFYGQSLFILATTLEPAAAGYISVQFPVAPPNITFVTSAPNTDFTYQIIYI
jgi:hypothetical protein